MQSARAVLSSVASLAPPYFSALSHKRHDFRGEKLLISVVGSKDENTFSYHFQFNLVLILFVVHSLLDECVK
jgi:hypothetical protein